MLREPAIMSSLLSTAVLWALAFTPCGEMEAVTVGAVMDLLYPRELVAIFLCCAAGTAVLPLHMEVELGRKTGSNRWCCARHLCGWHGHIIWQSHRSISHKLPRPKIGLLVGQILEWSPLAHIYLWLLVCSLIAQLRWD